MTNIKRTTPEDPDFCNLIALLDQDLWKRYPSTQQNYVAHNVMKLDAKVVIAYQGGQPAGCGCFREAGAPGTVEIKRMFVVEQARGKGIASAILTALEQWAAETGYTAAILETGAGQPEAIALYTKLGYRRIANYEPYCNSAESVCMSKVLEGG